MYVLHIVPCPNLNEHGDRQINPGPLVTLFSLSPYTAWANNLKTITFLLFCIENVAMEECIEIGEERMILEIIHQHNIVCLFVAFPYNNFTIHRYCK